MSNASSQRPSPFLKDNVTYMIDFAVLLWSYVVLCDGYGADLRSSYSPSMQAWSIKVKEHQYKHASMLDALHSATSVRGACRRRNQQRTCSCSEKGLVYANMGTLRFRSNLCSISLVFPLVSFVCLSLTLACCSDSRPGTTINKQMQFSFTLAQ